MNCIEILEHVLGLHYMNKGNNRRPLLNKIRKLLTGMKILVPLEADLDVTIDSLETGSSDTK